MSRIITMMNGHAARVISSRDTFPIRHPMKRQTPRGGVTIPTARFTTMRTPKCNGSIPSCVMTGRSTGTRMMIEATVSMNVPMKSNKTLIRNMTMTGFRENERIDSATLCGIFWAVRIQLNTDDVAMMNMIIAVPTTELTRISFRSLK